MQVMSGGMRAVVILAASLSAAACMTYPSEPQYSTRPVPAGGAQPQAQQGPYGQPAQPQTPAQPYQQPPATAQRLQPPTPSQPQQVETPTPGQQSKPEQQEDRQRRSHGLEGLQRRG